MIGVARRRADENRSSPHLRVRDVDISAMMGAPYCRVEFAAGFRAGTMLDVSFRPRRERFRCPERDPCHRYEHENLSADIAIGSSPKGTPVARATRSPEPKHFRSDDHILAWRIA